MKSKKRIKINYNENGKVETIECTSKYEYIEKETYNARGNLISELTKNGEIFKFEYDEEDNLIHENLVDTETWYNKGGFATRTIDHETGKEITYKYNDQNFCIYSKIKDGNETFIKRDKNGVITYKLEKDSRGNVIRREINEITEHFRYDKNNKLIRYWSSNGNHRVYQYDTYCNLISVVDNKGNIIYPV